MKQDNECCSTIQRKSEHSEKTKKDMLTRLNKIEGQIRGIKKLIEHDTYCDDILNQVAASQSALNAVAKILLEAHIKTCIINRIQENDMESIDELMLTIKKLIR